MAKDQDKKAAAQDKLELVQSADAVKQDKKTVRMPRRLRKEKGKEKTRKSVKEMISELKKGHLAYPQGIHQLQRMRFCVCCRYGSDRMADGPRLRRAYQAAYRSDYGTAFAVQVSRGVAANE